MIRGIGSAIGNEVCRKVKEYQTRGIGPRNITVGAFCIYTRRLRNPADRFWTLIGRNWMIAGETDDEHVRGGEHHLLDCFTMPQRVGVGLVSESGIFYNCETIRGLASIKAGLDFCIFSSISTSPIATISPGEIPYSNASRYYHYEVLHYLGCWPARYDPFPNCCRCSCLLAGRLRP